jgi:hypothetical protein
MVIHAVRDQCDLDGKSCVLRVAPDCRRKVRWFNLKGKGDAYQVDSLITATLHLMSIMRSTMTNEERVKQVRAHVADFQRRRGRSSHDFLSLPSLPPPSPALTASTDLRHPSRPLCSPVASSSRSPHCEDGSPSTSLLSPQPLPSPPSVDLAPGTGLVIAHAHPVPSPISPTPTSSSTTSTGHRTAGMMCLITLIAFILPSASTRPPLLPLPLPPTSSSFPSLLSLSSLVT